MMSTEHVSPLHHCEVEKLFSPTIVSCGPSVLGLRSISLETVEVGDTNSDSLIIYILPPFNFIQAQSHQ
jgi:hypothetical protein